MFINGNFSWETKFVWFTKKNDLNLTLKRFKIDKNRTGNARWWIVNLKNQIKDILTIFVADKTFSFIEKLLEFRNISRCFRSIILKIWSFIWRNHQNLCKIPKISIVKFIRTANLMSHLYYMINSVVWIRPEPRSSLRLLVPVRF